MQFSEVNESENPLTYYCMALMVRALVTWVLILIFVIVLAFRLDKRILWNWFLVFTPLWNFWLISFVYAMWNLGVRCHNQMRVLTLHGKMAFGRTLVHDAKLRNAVVNLLLLLFSLVFLVLLCIRLEQQTIRDGGKHSDERLNVYVLFVPFWACSLTILLVVTWGFFQPVFGSPPNVQSTSASRRRASEHMDSDRRAASVAETTSPEVHDTGGLDL